MNSFVYTVTYSSLCNSIQLKSSAQFCSLFCGASRQGSSGLPAELHGQGADGGPCLAKLLLSQLCIQKEGSENRFLFLSQTEVTVSKAINQSINQQSTFDTNHALHTKIYFNILPTQLMIADNIQFTKAQEEFLLSVSCLRQYIPGNWKSYLFLPITELREHFFSVQSTVVSIW